MEEHKKTHIQTYIYILLCKGSLELLYFEELRGSFKIHQQWCFFKDFIYLFIRQTEIISRQTGRQRDREREKEAGSPLSREPDAGLDPRTLRS